MDLNESLEGAMVAEEAERERWEREEACEGTLTLFGW